MKKFNLISPTYKGKVNFDGFILNFNVEGKAVVEIEDKDIEKFENVLNNYPNLFEGDVLPEQKKEVVVESTEKSEVSNDEFEILKNSNIKLAKENASLKKENENLKAENESLKLENERLKAEIDSNNSDEGSEEQKPKLEENNQNPEEEEKGEGEQKPTEINEENIEAELNSKTVTELKSILKDVYGEFREEWKSLTKKDEIVEYIKNKTIS